MLERELKISRYAIIVITMIVSFVTLINEDISVKMVIIPLFAVISYFSCLLGKKVCLKMVARSDKISNLFLKIIYLISIPIFIFLCMICFVMLAKGIYSQSEYSNDMAVALSRAFYYLISCAGMLIFLIIPYVQMLMILFIRKFIK